MTHRSMQSNGGWSSSPTKTWTTTTTDRPDTETDWLLYVERYLMPISWIPICKNSRDAVKTTAHITSGWRLARERGRTYKLEYCWYSWYAPQQVSFYSTLPSTTIIITASSMTQKLLYYNVPSLSDLHVSPHITDLPRLYVFSWNTYIWQQWI